jgi:hypothetical protein
MPERPRLLQCQRLRDLDHVPGRGRRREMGHLRRVLCHPLIDALAERRLRPAGVDRGGGDAVVFQRRGPFVREHVQRGLGHGVGVELAGHEGGDVGGGEDGGDEDDAFEFGFLDEREECAGDAQGRDGAEGHFICELVEVPDKEGKRLEAPHGKDQTATYKFSKAVVGWGFLPALLTR